MYLVEHVVPLREDDDAIFFVLQQLTEHLDKMSHLGSILLNKSTYFMFFFDRLLLLLYGIRLGVHRGPLDSRMRTCSNTCVSWARERGFLHVGHRCATSSALSMHCRQYMWPHLHQQLIDDRKLNNGVPAYGVMVRSVTVSKHITQGSSVEAATCGIRDSK